MARTKRPNTDSIFVGTEIPATMQERVRLRAIQELGLRVTQRSYLTALLGLYADGLIDLRPEDLRTYAPEPAGEYELA